MDLHTSSVYAIKLKYKLAISTTKIKNVYQKYCKIVLEEYLCIFSQFLGTRIRWDSSPEFFLIKKQC